MVTVKKSSLKSVIVIFLMTILLLQSCQSHDNQKEFPNDILIKYNGDYDLENVAITLKGTATEMKVNKVTGNYYVRLREDLEKRGIEEFCHLYIRNGKPESIDLFYPALNVFGRKSYPKELNITVIREVDTSKLIR